MTMLIPLLAFVFGSLLIVGAAMILSPSGASVIERRLGEVTGKGGFSASAAREAHYSDAIVHQLKRLGTVAPKSISETSKIRQRLVAAGYRNNEAIYVFFGIRLGLAILAFVLLASPFLVKPNLAVALG